MILNTDLPVSEQLKSDENIGLFVCLSIPLKLKQTVEIIWEVGLHSQFNEIIENCDSSVTKDFIIFILENDKFWKSDDNFKLFFNFWRSLFYKIHYIGKGYQEDPNIMTMTMFFEKCMQLINEQLEVAFKTPLWEKNTSTKNNFFYFFNTVLAIIRFYNDVKYQYEPNNVFKLSIKFQSVQDLTLIEPSKACLNLIFTYLPKLMQGVSMNSWKNLTDSAWQEVKENIYYICKETMDVIPQALQHLEPFAVEPDLPEIPTTDIDKIISHVKRGEKDWFKVLILQEEIEKKTIDASSPSASPDKNAAVGSMMNKTSEDLQGLPEFNNIEVIDCLLEKFNFADPDDHFIILKKCVSSLLSDKPEELEAKIRKLFLKALKYESPNENSESFLTNVFRNHANAIPRLEIELDSSETEDFNEELNLAFNKFSNEESVRLYDVARLCLQSREKCLIKIYRAAINDSKQVNVCLNVVNDLKGAFECRSRDSDHLSFLESVLLKFIATEKLTEKEQNLFILFFRGLVQKNLIDFKFYDEIISILNLKLQEESYEIIFFLQLIKTGIKCKSFEKFKFCFLLFMSDVLKSLSWNFDNFSNVKAEGRNLVGSLVLKIIGSLDQAGKANFISESPRYI